MRKYRVQWRQYHTMDIEVGDEVDKKEAKRLVRLSLDHRASADNFTAVEVKNEKVVKKNNGKMDI